MREDAIEGLQSISKALKGRTAVLGGQPFEGDPRFGFPSSALASVLDKEEPWEFVSKPEKEASSAQDPLPSEPKLDTHRPADDPKPVTKPPKNPIVNSKSKYLPQKDPEAKDASSISTGKEASALPPKDGPEVAETLSKRRSVSEPPVLNLSRETPKPEAPNSQGASSNSAKEIPSQKPSIPNKILSPTNSTKAKVDNKKLKQVREQYDWIFGSDQNKPKSTKSVSSLTEKPSSFASCDLLGTLSVGASAEDFLSTLRTPPRASHRKTPSLSGAHGLPSMLKSFSPDPSSDPFVAPELPKPEAPLWSSPPSADRSLSPTASPSANNDFIDVMFTTPQDGFEISKPLVPPPRPTDEFFSNPW